MPSEVVKVDVEAEWMPVIVHVSGHAPELIDLTNVKSESVFDQEDAEVIDLTKGKDVSGNHPEGEREYESAAHPKSEVIDLTSDAVADGPSTNEQFCVKQSGDNAGNSLVMNGKEGGKSDVSDVFTEKNSSGASESPAASSAGESPQEDGKSILYSPSSPADSDDFLDDIPGQDEQNQLMNSKCAWLYNSIWSGKMCTLNKIQSVVFV